MSGHCTTWKPYNLQFVNIQYQHIFPRSPCCLHGRGLVSRWSSQAVRSCGEWWLGREVGGWCLHMDQRGGHYGPRLIIEYKFFHAPRPHSSMTPHPPPQDPTPSWNLRISWIWNSPPWLNRPSREKIALIYKRLCWLSNQICAPDIRLASGTISANVDTASKSKEAILDKERECSLWSRKAGKCPSLCPWWGRGWADRVLGQFSNLVEVLFFQPSRPSRGRTDYKGLFCHHSTWSQKRDNKLCFVNPHFSIFNFENLSHNW